MYIFAYIFYILRVYNVCRTPAQAVNVHQKHLTLATREHAGMAICIVHMLNALNFKLCDLKGEQWEQVSPKLVP